MKALLTLALLGASLAFAQGPRHTAPYQGKPGMQQTKPAKPYHPGAQQPGKPNHSGMNQGKPGMKSQSVGKQRSKPMPVLSPGRVGNRR